MIFARLALPLGLAFGAAACAGEVSTLPPHGEALFVVDTDLPVPTLASRLRVDLYSESGVWFESRDTSRSNPSDWPTSFGVFSDDDTRERSVLVRLRVYPEGAVRDYAGERYAERKPYASPRVASDLADLCENAPKLAFGERITQRSGPTALTEIVAYRTCQPPFRGGLVGARVDVTRAGRYRFSVAGQSPFDVTTTLFLRSHCDDPTSQLACRTELKADPRSSGHLPRFDVELQPGSYWLMAGDAIGDFPADITLEAMELADDEAAELPPLVTSEPVSAPPPALPRLDRRGAEEHDETPATEPLPTAAIDRLVLVRLKPGKRGIVPVTLRGSCAGTMAKLGSDPTKPDLSTATTCVDREAERAPLVETALSTGSPTRASEQGTFATGEACASGDTTGDIACIPAGAFLLGSSRLTLFSSTAAQPTPERIAKMNRFYIDKHEVTVARLREAVARGFALDERRIRFNDSTFRPLPAPALVAYCTYSHAPAGREDYAVSCINWSLAREFCRFVGGDLPTEAEWEFAATAAGRPYKTIYPWGDEPPTCARASYFRAPQGVLPSPGDCVTTGADGKPADFGPTPAHAHDGSDGNEGDVTVHGVVALGGGVSEWIKDSGESFDGPCWNATPLTHPECFEDVAPYRSMRGGSWLTELLQPNVRVFGLGGAASGNHPFFAANSDIGFRCAYREPPR